MRKYIISLLCIILSANVFAALSLPNLVYPKNNQHGALPLVKLDVEDNPNATIYEFLLDVDPSLANARLYSSSQSIVYIDSLKFGTNYYWKYRVKNATDSSAWSTVSKFWTMSGKMTPIFPIKYNQVFSTDEFSFSNSYLKNFKIEISVTRDFKPQDIYQSFYVQDTNLNDNNTKFMVDSLEFGKYYWWRVTAYTNSDTMVGDSIQFSVKNIVDFHYTKIVDLKLDMAVKPYSGATHYRFQIDTTDNSFNNIIIDTLLADTLLFLDDLDYDVVLYARAAAVNSVGQSNWRYKNYLSNGIKFTTVRYDGYKGRTNQPEVFIEMNKPYNTQRVILEYDTSYSFDSPLKITHDLLMDSVKNKYYILDTVRDLHFDKYYLRGKVFGETDTSDWVMPYSNQIDVKSYIIFLSPQSSYTVRLAADIEFIWPCDYKNVTHYMVQLDTTLNFNSSEQINKIVPTRYDSEYDTFTVKAKLGKTYYARSRIWHDKDTADWSGYKIVVTYGRPELKTPNNGSGSGKVANFFTWDNFESEASKFIFQLDTVETFNSNVLLDTLVQQYGPLKQVQVYDQFYDQKYYWRVKAILGSDTTEWSDTWTFSTTEYFYVYNPSNGAVNIPWDHRMLWNGMEGTRGFQMEIDTNADLSTSKILDRKISYIQESYTFKPYELYMGDTNYWRIRFYTYSDTTEWQELKYFVTRKNNPIRLISPVNGATASYGLVNLKWNKFGSDGSYRVYISENPDMSDYDDVFLSDTTYTFLADLGKEYYWSVKSINSNPSAIWKFASGNTYPSPILIKPANNSTNLSGNINFTWSSVSTGSYKFELSTNPDMSGSSIQTLSDTNTSQFGLSRSLTYYWRVRFVSGANNGEWSDIFTFNTYKVGIDNVEEIPLIIYPNPSTGIFNMVFDTPNDQGTLQVFNALNQKVMEREVNGAGELTIDLSNQPAGIYYLRYSQADKIYTTKILKY